MFVSDNLGVNASGNLTIGGVDTVALAKKYGTDDSSRYVNGILGAIMKSAKSAE